MSLKKTLSLFIFTLCFSSTFAQLPDSLKSHIDSALLIMQQHSIYADKVNWAKAKQQAYADAAGAKNREQLFTAIANVYRQLGDHHGKFLQYNDRLQLVDSSAIKRYTSNLTKEWAKGPKIKTEMLGTVAYIRFPNMPAFQPKQVDFYANWLADSVASLAARKPTAWIMDLRLNSGGNIVPMMAPLAAFFNNGILSYYTDKKQKWEPVVIKEGVFFVEDTVKASLKRTLPDLRKIKVAIITGPGTASSGEGVATYFTERGKLTRIFGEKTAGFANSTQGFLFNNESSYFLLTTSILANSKKKPLPEFVTPNTEVKNNDLFDDLPNDNAVKAALNWLK